MARCRWCNTEYDTEEEAQRCTDLEEPEQLYTVGKELTLKIYGHLYTAVIENTYVILVNVPARTHQRRYKVSDQAWSSKQIDISQEELQKIIAY